MEGNYKDHAAVWDWDAYDNSNEYEFWCNFASKYGKNVLIPMCALGENAAYMAKKGFNVTAFDIVNQMIAEGEKRFGEIDNLKLLVGNICDFNFKIDLIDFTFIKDLGHLLKEDDVEKAFFSINKHMRKGGCIVLVLELPGDESYDWPREVYYPRKPKYFDKRVWKTGEGNYDSKLQLKKISQRIYIENSNGIKTFDHEFYYKLYDKKTVEGLLKKTGYKITNEYKNYELEKWNGENNVIIEGNKI